MSERNLNRRPAARSGRPLSTPTPARRPSRPRQVSPIRRYARMKWALLALLLAYAVLVVRANSARDVAFDFIDARMAQAPGLSELKRIDENAFQERLDAIPEGCEGWLMYGSDEIMNVSELLIAKGGEEALSRLEDAARARVERQLNVFRSYGTDQGELLEDAVIFTRGSYLFYAVGKDAQTWRDLFLACVR